MHIGFLTPEFPHENCQGRVAGIGTSIKNLVTNFVMQGHQVSIFIHNQNEDATYSENSISIIHIKNTNKKILNWYWTRKKIEKIINKSVVNDGLVIVEAPDWTGITAFMSLKCKLLIRLHGSDTYFCKLEQRKQKLKNFFLEKKALNNSDAILSVSRYTADVTKKIFNLNKNIDVIYNGIDLDNFQLSQDIKPQSKMILYFGTLIRKKGVLEIPGILKELKNYHPDAKLVMIGNDDIDALDGISTWKLIQDSSDKEILNMIEYRGPVPYHKMREAILEAKVCIFPSYAEAFPVAWLEAMACRKPVVASNIGWASEVIEDGVSGLLCSPNDHKSYAKYIKNILDDEHYTKTLGNKARDRIENLFSAKNIASENIKYYDKVIMEKSI